MKTRVIDTLPEYIEFATQNFELNADKRKRLFFRGQSSSNYKLLPGVLREDHPESDFSHQFRDKAAITDTTPPFNERDRWLFLAQHHGLPTRLLDWSESPLVALHFALNHSTGKGDAEVFALDPTRLNNKSLGGFWYPDRADPCYQYRFLKAFYRNPENLPWDLGVDIQKIPNKELPLAISPVVVHPRMTSQLSMFNVQCSMFTVHGDDHTDLQDMFAKRKFKGLLAKAIVPEAKKRHLLIDLKKVGVSRSTIFPDLGGIAEELVARTKKNMEM